MDSLLGKRHITCYPASTALQGLWGCDVGMLSTGVWGQGVGKGAYDQPYIGQHQQGIPFTHPLKRIRMEQC